MSIRYKKKINKFKNKLLEWDFWNKKIKGRIGRSLDGNKDFKDWRNKDISKLDKFKIKKIKSWISSKNTKSCIMMESLFKPKGKSKKHINVYNNIKWHINKC
jgi:hypothetical protein